ncbi:magnesium transporter MgtE N-terminal domain-containing protein, partial [Corynebacterium nuruki]|uniref:magnesium transporter MgtE N-terminal domain-containing protein n=1 Tax=Corynebacterium nuruki TaxID=1032851 RepID=UPI0039BEDD04
MDLTALHAGLGELNTVEIADEMSRLDTTDQAVLFRLLDKDRASQVFEYRDVAHQAALLDELREGRSAERVLDLPVDDRARPLDEMPAKDAARMLAGLP